MDTLDMAAALERVQAYLSNGQRPHSIFAVNPEKCLCVPRDKRLHDAFAQADLLIPDGIGVVLAARLLHGARLKRVPGVDLMGNICQMAAQKAWGIFLYGAREEVNRAAAESLTRLYPGLTIAGRSHGYISEDQMHELIKDINASKAKILFLALGSPRQEDWFFRYAHELKHVRVCQGVGGSLDVTAGMVKRAPVIWRRFGLEWLYRVLREPRRLKRQKMLPVFAFRVFHEMISG